MKKIFIITISGLLMLSAACQPSPSQPPLLVGEGSLTPKSVPSVLAVETFLADIAQNVAGQRLQVDTLMPLGLDIHAFEPTPKDIARIAQSNVLIVHGKGLEGWLEEVLHNAGGNELMVIEAAAGLVSRQTQLEEGIVQEEGHQHEEGNDDGHKGHSHEHEGDPHFWLDPNLVIHYVENIRNGLSQADPAGAEIYAQNAQAYIAQLQELDAWIRQQVESLPPERRVLVTNHESFGYFADRYGFRLVGSILPSVSTNAAPSAQQLAHLIEQIRRYQVKAIFLETGSNPQLAQQIAQETGINVITELYTHSLSAPDGPAPTYIDMMRYNVLTIVNALK